MFPCHILKNLQEHLNNAGHMGNELSLAAHLQVTENSKNLSTH